jgi:hypothetical protein
MSKLSCGFWRLGHRWGKWMDVETMTIAVAREVNGVERPDLPNKVIGKALIQERRCERCNKLQRYMVQTTIMDIR